MSWQAYNIDTDQHVPVGELITIQSGQSRGELCELVGIIAPTDMKPRGLIRVKRDMMPIVNYAPIVCRLNLRNK